MRTLALSALAAALAAAAGAPKSPGDRFDVRSFGAVGDGAHSDTGAFQAALDAAAAAGGGTVVAGAGRYAIAPLRLRSQVTLHLERGATLLGSPRPADYPAVPSRWEGEDRPTHMSLIEGRGVENVAIVGAGTIDGRGQVWWDLHRKGELDLPRPRLVEFIESRDVRVEGVTLMNSPSWTLHPLYSENVTIHGVTIRNPPDSPNTDGIDPDSSRNVRISDCDIDTGDDGVALKSGRRPAASGSDRPTENVTIKGCRFRSSHAAVAIGSETAGGVRGVVISDSVIEGSQWGLRVKSRRGRGGTIEDVSMSDIEMRDVARPLIVDLFYGDDADEMSALPVNEGTPRVRGLRIEDVVIQGAQRAAKLVGLPERPLEAVTLARVTVAAKRGIEAVHVDDLVLEEVQVGARKKPAATIGPGQRLRVLGLRVLELRSDEPALLLHDVRGARISISALPPGGRAPVLRLSGRASSGIQLGQAAATAGRPRVGFSRGANPEALAPARP